MNELSAARAEIDRIDSEMARLFEQRMFAAAEIAAWKRENGRPVLDAVRERELIARNSARISDPALQIRYAAFLKELLAESRAYQESILNPEAMTVRAAGGSYPIVMRRGVLGKAGTVLNLNRRVFLVTDEGIPAAYPEALAAQCGQRMIHTVPAGEASKSPDALVVLLEAMLRAGLTRSDCVLAVGGGVVGDLAGLAAALYMRGIDFYNVPTTLLSMIDASIGGKTAVNLAGVKNAVGAFWPPKAVLVDPNVLETLPSRQLSNGLAEAVKMALTHDSELFTRFENPEGYGSLEDVITACLRIKRSVVEADERETSYRRVLNFGHTLGHGIESAAGGRLLHGECVALGMLPMCAPSVRGRLISVLKHLGLPVKTDIDVDLAMKVIAHDKKSADGSVEIVTVPELGRFAFRRVSLEELRGALLTLGKEQT
ncbi:MAG: 3-dehydroquinate synthase [Oscillospiraceae bacterium]|nr:3-dehydroquinate synthase [Oscillospiraceae bacterium]